MRADQLKEGDRVDVKPESRADDWQPATYVKRHEANHNGPALRGHHWVKLDEPRDMIGSLLGTMLGITDRKRQRIIVPASRMRRSR